MRIKISFALLEAVCGYWALTWAHGQFLQSGPTGAGEKTGHPHRLSSVFCSNLTEEFGERQGEKCAV